MTGKKQTPSVLNADRGRHIGSRLFAVTCGIWLLLSFVGPSLPYFDAALVLLAVSGGLWVASVLWIIVPLGALAIGAKRIFARQYVSAIVWAVVPAAGVFLYFGGTHLADTIRFRLEKTDFDRVVADVSAGRCSRSARKQWNVAVDEFSCQKPIIVVFPWGGFLSNWYGIIYDAADQIAKAPKDRSPAWKGSDIGKALSCSGAKFSLGGHYHRAGGSYVSGTDACG
ncbi:MAG TPA: hypothetical protein VIJ42_10730 [Stellaceae bacterium]